MNTKITPTLDKIEENLPPISARILRLNRKVVGLGFNAAESTGKAVFSTVRSVANTVATSGRTVAGQAESAGERVISTTKAGAKEVTGQARAQALRTMDDAEQEVTSLLDSGIEIIEDRPAGSYDSWTKAQLYDRAQEVDIDGRSSMSKNELIKALRGA